MSEMRRVTRAERHQLIFYSDTLASRLVAYPHHQLINTLMYPALFKTTFGNQQSVRLGRVSCYRKRISVFSS